jgi:hypothetical protein
MNLKSSARTIQGSLKGKVVSVFLQKEKEKKRQRTQRNIVARSRNVYTSSATLTA